jgi:hypothetical protein
LPPSDSPLGQWRLTVEPSKRIQAFLFGPLEVCGDGRTGGWGIMPPNGVHDRFMFGGHVSQIVAVHRLTVTQAQPGHEVGQRLVKRRIVGCGPKHLVPLRIQLPGGRGIRRCGRVLVQLCELSDL